MGWQLSKLVIAAIIISGIISGITLVVGHAADVMGLTAYDESELEAYQQLDALNTNLLEVRTEATGIQNPEGALDQIGYQVVGAYNAAKLTFQAYNIIIVMTNAAINGFNLGPFGSVVQQMINSILLAILFIGIVFYWIFKVPT